MRGAVLAVGLAAFLIAIGTAAFRVTSGLSDVDLGKAPLIFGGGCVVVAALIGFFIFVQRRGG